MSDLKKTLQVAKVIRELLFEEEFGELKDFTPSQVELLRKTFRMLNKVFDNKYGKMR